MSTPQLSLFSAILINLNIIIGSGVFINTAELAKRAGIFGGLCYAIVGLLLFPLILSFVRLLQLYPGGGFYSFAEKSLCPFVGFLSTWCYFTTKLSSATLIIHIFGMWIQQLIPFFAQYNNFGLDICILSIIVCANLLNAKSGNSLQKWFIVFKLFPILLVIISGIFLIQGSHFTPIHQLWTGIPTAIPLVLHAMLGFETACSISRNIKNPRVNAPRAVLISYGIVITLYFFYQTIFYGILGTNLTAQPDVRSAFPLLIKKLTANAYLQSIIMKIIDMFIATSAISAGFGIIYANMWNLYSLAELRHTIAPNFLIKLNRFNIPFICVLAQGIISLLLIIIIRNEITTFQQLSALGATITYTISIIGLAITLKKNGQRLWLPLLGFINCCILLCASSYAMWWSHNVKPLMILSGLIALGVIMYTHSKRHNEKIDTLKQI